MESTSEIASVEESSAFLLSKKVFGREKGSFLGRIKKWKIFKADYDSGCPRLFGFMCKIRNFCAGK